MKIEIPMRLPSLNEYIYASKISKGKWNKGNQMKQDTQRDIMPYLKKLGKYDKPVRINFIWIEPDYRRDLDNVCFAKKFILDAMVQAGVITNDNRKHVTGFTDYFDYDKGNPRVIVEVLEDG